MVRELEYISLDAVWDLPVVQFLNDLVYLKEKEKYINAINKQGASGGTRRPG
jgi:hypothetical protein